MTKLLAGSVLGAALIAAPLFAFAHDDNSDANVKFVIGDKTAVSINIMNNGSTLVRGARVTDVNDDVVTAETSVNGTTLTWTVDTDNDTDFVEADSSESSRGKISDGDYISFSGMLDGSLRVNADTVRDWSIGDSVTARPWLWSHVDQWPVVRFFMGAHTDAGNSGKK